MADFNNTNLADFSGVWVFCERSARASCSRPCSS